MLFICATLAPFVLRILQATPRERLIPVAAFPWWGWGRHLDAGAVGLAWTRFEWMQPFQAHTFFPLWVGYIVLVNADVPPHRPVHGAESSALFRVPLPLSAGFGGVSEYLNRFVQNWYLPRWR